jgi:hypothetical protein
MPQGGGGSAITAAAPSRKRRADALGPAATAAADVPTHGILLPTGEVPVFSFSGGPVVDEKALRGVDAAVDALGGKAGSGNWLSSLKQRWQVRVLHLLRLQLVAMSAVATVATTCGQPKKSKRGRPTNLLTQAVETVLDGVAPRVHPAGRGRVRVLKRARLARVAMRRPPAAAALRSCNRDAAISAGNVAHGRNCNALHVGIHAVASQGQGWRADARYTNSEIRRCAQPRLRCGRRIVVELVIDFFRHDFSHKHAVPLARVHTSARR